MINQLWGAGAETSLRAFLLNSLEQDVEHAVVVLKPQGNRPEPLEEAGVRIYVPGELSGRLGNIRHVRASIADFQPDLLHTSLFEADLAGRIAAWMTRTPVISSFVNAAYGAEAAAAEVAHPLKVRTSRQLDSVLARHATTGFHSISIAAAAHASEHLGVAMDRIRVVPRGRAREQLGCRSEERRARVRRAEGWGGDATVLINVARQEPQKGHTFLIEAFAKVREGAPESLLVLVGRPGRATPAIERCIRQHALQAAVVQLGARDDVPDLLAAADLFVFPSLYEGLGGAVIEAAGLGLPVVCADLPALREVLGEDHPCYVPAADPGALAAAILDVLRDPEWASVIGRRSRERFERHFCLDAAVEGMLKLYRDAIAELSQAPARNRWRRVPRITEWP